MKRTTMMMVVGLATLGSTAARAQAPDSSPSPVEPPAQEAPPAAGIDAPAAPATQSLPDEVPALETPETPPPPAPPVAPVVVPAPVASPYAVEEVRAYPVWMNKLGTAVMLGGGYEDFTQAAPKAATNAGGSWDLRVAAGTRQFIGLEAAYVGGARNVNGLGFATNTTLINNGVEGNLRVNIPLVAGRALIEPFGFIGLGWQHYSLSKTVATADVTRSDDVMTMPYGGGLMAAYGRFMVDARIQWRDTFYNNMFSVTGSKLNTWGAGGNVGVEF